MALTRPTSPYKPQAALHYPRKTVVFCALMAYVLLVALSGVLNAPLPAAADDTHESSGSEASGPEKTPTAETGALDGSNNPNPSAENSDGSAGLKPQEASAQAASLLCTPGTVYGVSATGQLQQVSSNGTVTTIGSPAAGTSSFNGLGIGTGGTPIFGYERTNNARTATIYSFNSTTEKWTQTGSPFNTTTAANGSFDGSLVAGAVDLASQSGRFYFGGFTSNGQQFKIYRYNPAANTFEYKGYVDTSTGAGSTNNGDIAFDSQGNLFIVRGSGTTTTIFSVTNDALAAAGGGKINASGSRGVTTIGSVNGVAFDSQGKAYLGNSKTVASYDMPNWSNPTTVTTGANSTDLASCSSPATITLEKDVKKRVATGDQFGLSLSQGGTVLGSTTTEGTNTGVQSQRVGPLPVARGTAIRFAETAAGTTDLNKYASSYSCTADGTPISPTGDGTSATITIPASGNEIVCRFVNSPMTADVTINKQTQNQTGGDQKNAAGWTVGAAATATSGTVSQSPTATTQQTGTDGNAKWTLNFNSKTASARLAVLEQQQSGFEFVSGTCKITRLDGTSTNVSLTGAGSQTLSQSIVPGDDVSCGYINKKRGADVTVNKTWNIDGKTYANGSQPAGISAKLLLDPSGSPSTDPAFGQRRAGFAIGDSVKIGETTTIDAQKFPGCTMKSKTISGDGINGTVPLTENYSTTLPGSSNSYSVTNTVECQTLTIIKKVENDNGGTLTPADWNKRLFATPGSGSKLTYDSGEKKYVPMGSFAITEDTLVGYDQNSFDCTGATYNNETKTVAIKAGQNAVCTVTNNDSSGTASWKKTNDGGQALDGSEWTLRGPDGSEVTIDDCVADSAEGCTGRDVDPEAGSFRINGLDWGDYTLIETRAPAGYVLDETEHEFTITREQLDHQFDAPFVNEQAESPQLPLTGGTGTVGFVIGGVALLAGCAAGVIWLQRRRSQERG
ncbi:LPXTG-motif cell wall anchor domain-containing protein [Brevibacterium aurantiacum]|uniref:LPXTG-motif cell wall anchor domain-containing protein n=1 Tax=Brevibacterium aurantiacum TaxID=273384 RepID=A0A2H1KZN8_BREAU|nr:prealbumin-like fold domain-containing protein [Brevibacterium aurantiacum]SMY05233.1 LPXTG-motif cell wall anchor domain-containing protein [Brevibacterium aurantiacum]